jgi:hypothetical protein
MKSRAFEKFASVALLLVGAVAALTAADVPRTPAGSPEGAQSEANRQAEPQQPSPKDEFAQMDSDNDGRISAYEYAASPQSAIDRIAAGKRNGPAGITGGFGLANNEGRPDRSRFFKKLDADGDGYLSRSEVSADSASAGKTDNR